MKLQIKMERNPFKIGDDVEYVSPIRRQRTKMGKVERVRGPMVIIRVGKNKERYIKNLIRRKIAPKSTILPSYNHPLTKIFK